jgi:hypothetical protein
MSELSPEARKLFELAREDFTPDQQRIARVQRALKAQLGFAAAATATAAAKNAGAATGFFGKLSLVATKLAGTAVIAGALGLAAHRVNLEMSADSQEPRALSGNAALDHARSLADRVQAPATAIVAPESLPRTVEESHAPPSNRATPNERAPHLPAPPIVLEESPESAGAPSAARALPQTARAAPLPADPGSSGASAPARPRESDTLAREVRILREARAELKGGKPEDALSLLDRHAKLHPRGALAEEQLAARALALCALGRAAEARAVVVRLERIAPRSPQLPKIRSACASSRRDR